VINQSRRLNIPEDRSNKKLSCAQQLGFQSVLNGLQRRIALIASHMLVLPAIIASTDPNIDEVEVSDLPIAQRPPSGIDPSLWTVSMLWSQLSDNDEDSRWLRQTIQALCEKI
jgi:hypothetical protein